MENIDQFVQMLEEFHPEQTGPRKKHPRLVELNAQKEVLHLEIEARVKEIEAFVLENENLNCALLWEGAKTLQGTKFYDSFVAFLQEHNIAPLPEQDQVGQKQAEKVL